MLSRHIKDSTFPVDVSLKSPETGPRQCPQVGCENGSVVFEECGGYSGNYVTKSPCKCCDGKGYLFPGEKAYLNACKSARSRHLDTYYPNPIPMSKEVSASPELDDWVKKPDEPKKEGCFIATAVYGDYNHPKVINLRIFRDEYLKKTWGGRIFIKIYYKTSPNVAEFIKRYPPILKIVRFLIDKISIVCGEKCNNHVNR